MTKPSQGDLRGLFLCSKEEVARCLGNRSVHVLIPTVLNLLKSGSVKCFAKRNIGDITNTTGIQSQGNATGVTSHFEIAFFLTVLGVDCGAPKGAVLTLIGALENLSRNSLARVV